MVISAIGGTAGVGKTALAVQWAHQVAGRFPDGQLYVNLRGYDPGQPVTAADALAGFLRALGVPGQDIPAEEDERAARYRSLLAGRRMLVVLDNAGSVEQVRPLLPGAAGCVVLVTSRDALAGLVARDGARRLDLDLLPLPDAVGLLRALIGARVDADPAAAAALAERCARLPLALRVAAELAAARPDVPLAELAGELADQQRRLDLLDAGGDPRTAVRAVFSWSYRHLDADAGPGVPAGRPAPRPRLRPARRRRADRHHRGAGPPGCWTVLARAHLIQPAGPGRYGMHDLLRAYAAELAATEDGEEARRAALTRLFDYYLAGAAAAMDALYPAEQHSRPRPPASAQPVPPLPTAATARDWLDAERASLVGVGRARRRRRLARPRHRAGRGPCSATSNRRALPGGPGGLRRCPAGRPAGRRPGRPGRLAEESRHLSPSGRAIIQQAAEQARGGAELCRQLGDRRGQAGR